MKLLSVKPSDRPDKKYDATFEKEDGRTKTTSFGAKGMDDYTKTRDKEQRARYLERHGRGRENWSDPTSAGALSRHLLWGESTSLMTNLSNYRKRFNL
jgi:hypothetical protein